MDFSNALGVKSYCFREFKNPATLASMVRDCGVSRLDVSACHVDFGSVAAQEQLLGALGEQGITVVGLGVVTLRGVLATDRPFFEFCQRAGCRTISVNFGPSAQREVLTRAEALCDEFAMTCAIHNHGGTHWLGNSSMVRHLFSITPPSLGLCLDTAWAIDAGEDPVEWARSIGGRLKATHLKDFVFDRSGVPSDVVVGTGALDLPAYLQALSDVHFDGPFVIEYEGDPSDPVPVLQKCVAAVREALSGLRPTKTAGNV